MIQTISLGDLIKDIAMGPFGSNLKVDNFIESGVPVVKGGNLYSYEVGGNFSFVSEKKAQSLKRSLAYPDDIVITHRGTLGQVSIVPRNGFPYYLASQSQLRLTPDKTKINPRYLLYYLRSSIGQFELMQHASQVGVPSIATPTKAIKSLKITFPELDSQKKIVEILSSLDEKIELNRQMNETLEQMGQSLFRHYFIDNPEAERWGILPLDNEQILKVIKPRINKFDGYKNYIATANVSNNNVVGNLEIISSEKRPSRANMQPVCGSIWFSKMIGEHKAIIIDELDDEIIDDSILSTGFMGLLPKDKYKYYIWSFINSNIFAFEKRSLATGAVMVALNNGSFSKINIKIPPECVLVDFNIKVTDLYKLFSVNSRETKVLTTLRDTLLPRLISGKTKV